MPQAPPPTITAGTWDVSGGIAAARNTRAGCWAMAGLSGDRAEAAEPAARV